MSWTVAGHWAPLGHGYVIAQLAFSSWGLVGVGQTNQTKTTTFICSSRYRMFLLCDFTKSVRLNSVCWQLLRFLPALFSSSTVHNCNPDGSINSTLRLMGCLKTGGFHLNFFPSLFPWVFQQVPFPIPSVEVRGRRFSVGCGFFCTLWLNMCW